MNQRNNLIEQKVKKIMELIESKLEFLPSDNEVIYEEAVKRATTRKKLMIENYIRSSFGQICEAVATEQNESVHQEVQKIKPLVDDLMTEVKKLDVLSDQSIPKAEIDTPEGRQVSFFINKN